MLKSIQSKLVLLFILVILSVMMTVGTFILGNVTQFYYNDFMSQMETAFDDNFKTQLSDAVNSDDTEKKLKELMESRYGRIGVDSYRNYAVLSGTNGSFIFGSDEIEVQNIEATENVLSALNGEIGKKSVTGSDYIDYAYPVTKNNSVIYVIYVYETKQELNNFRTSMFTVVFEGLLFGLAVAFVLGYLLSRTITTPIKNLTERAEGIAKGVYDIGEISTSKDEIGVLTNTFRTMGRRLKETVFQIEDQKIKLETIMEYSSDGIAAFDTDGRLILINPTAKKYLGITDTEGVTFDGFFSQMFDDISMGDFIYLDSNKQIVKETAWYDYYLKFYFGRFIYSGNVTGGIMVDVQNITQMKKLELSRREFVANVSHELRTPLTTVKAYVETLQSGSVDKETQEKFFATINHETDRMTRLVSDLLTLSRLDNGVKLNLKYMKLEDILCGVAEKLKFAADTKNQTITYNRLNEIPEIPIDEDKMEQVITNIVGNALKYTPDGGKIQIFSSYISDKAIVTVSDNGIGIAQEHLGRIFERFYRADKARSRDQGGTGLGLAIAKEIVNAHAGEIKIRSTLGKGTEITITIPVDRSFLKKNDDENGNEVTKQ